MRNDARWRLLPAVLLSAFAAGLSACHSIGSAGDHQALVLDESIVYTTTQPRNGAGPLWDFNASNISRLGETVWVSGLSTVPGLPPLNNTECNLWRRSGTGWDLVHTLPGLTREPCPMGVLHGRRLVVSTNPTLNARGKAGGGPARPGLWEFGPARPGEPPTVSQPEWSVGAGPFTEHSYRSMAVDGQRGEVFLMQNVGSSHADWAFRDGADVWSAQGRLDWPSASVDGRSEPQRVAYVVALVANRAVHLLGVSDVVEPNSEWREYKRKLTGKDWDYVFRNLYYTWTPDITTMLFRPWVTVASREATAGRIVPGDLWLAPDGSLHAVWEEAALDDRLRQQFFPAEAQVKGIGYAVIQKGEVERRGLLMPAVGGQPGPVAHGPRLHSTPDGRLFLFGYRDGQDGSKKPVSENFLVEIGAGGAFGLFRLPLLKPVNQYVVASTRLGNAPSQTLDVLGSEPGNGVVQRYFAVRIPAMPPKGRH